MGKYKLKTRKSVVKRFKVRKSGKVQKRNEGHSHYNANDTGSKKQRKKKLSSLIKKEGKNIIEQIPYN